MTSRTGDVTAAAAASDRWSSAARLGRPLAWMTAIVGLIAAALAITTPPRSGSFCRRGCIGYPYTDAAAFVPRDYWWLYPQSLLILLALALLVCAIGVLTPASRVFSSLAVVLFTLGTGVLLVDYAVQLAVLQPSLRRGEPGALSLVSQYNPHGVFIALEDLGYLLLGLALLTAAGAFTAASRLDHALRWVLATLGGLTVLTLPALTALYGVDLEYRYEVAAIAMTWVALVSSAMMLARWFGRATELPG